MFQERKLRGVWKIEELNLETTGTLQIAQNGYIDLWLDTRVDFGIVHNLTQKKSSSGYLTVFGILDEKPIDVSLYKAIFVSRNHLIANMALVGTRAELDDVSISNMRVRYANTERWAFVGSGGKEPIEYAEVFSGKGTQITINEPPGITAPQGFPSMNWSVDSSVHNLLSLNHTFVPEFHWEFAESCTIENCIKDVVEMQSLLSLLVAGPADPTDILLYIKGAKEPLRIYFPLKWASEGEADIFRMITLSEIRDNYSSLLQRWHELSSSCGGIMDTVTEEMHSRSYTDPRLFCLVATLEQWHRVFSQNKCHMAPGNFKRLKNAIEEVIPDEEREFILPQIQNKPTLYTRLVELFDLPRRYGYLDDEQQKELATRLKRARNNLGHELQSAGIDDLMPLTYAASTTLQMLILKELGVSEEAIRRHADRAWKLVPQEWLNAL